MPTSRETKKSLSSLQRGRPPTAKKPTRTLAARHTRKIIRTHHALHKQLAQAKASGDHESAKSIEATIEARGGLAAYQEASIQGQASSRGGDSSVELLKWLAPHSEPGRIDGELKVKGLKLLEVGALSTTNACSKSPIFDSVVRIDLHSQSPGILQQDFMLRPLPSSLSRDDDRFDVISLSLVLNYVPDAEQRGEMLRRTTLFLRSSKPGGQDFVRAPSLVRATPSLFLVLPGPCVSNSRYMDEHRLTQIMASLGYALLRKKETAKLYYSLWLLSDRPSAHRQDFRKVKLYDDKGRNNFRIELRAGS